MTAIARRSIRTLVALGVCTLTPLLLVSFRTSATSSPSSADASCNALHEWAKVYKGTTPTLETFTPFDRAHRVAIFDALTPDVRSALWQEQLHRVVQRPDLSVQQRDLIKEAIGLATPAMYAKDPATRQAAVEHATRAKAAFSSAEQRQWVYQLGGPISRPARAAAPTMWDRLASPFHASAQPAPWCECSFSWQDCWPCIGSMCRWQWDGCGPYGWFECDGICDYGQAGT
jgi:hypothetical protein